MLVRSGDLAGFARRLWRRLGGALEGHTGPIDHGEWRKLWVDLTERYEGNLLIVGHGGSIYALCQAVISEEPGIHTCCCCLIEMAGNADGWELRRDGSDTSHLSVTEES